MNKINQLYESKQHFLIKYGLEPNYVIVSLEGYIKLNKVLEGIRFDNKKVTLFQIMGLHVIVKDLLIDDTEFMLGVFEQPEGWSN